MTRDVLTVVLAGCLVGVAALLAEHSATSSVPVRNGVLVPVLLLVVGTFGAALFRLKNRTDLPTNRRPSHLVILGIAAALGAGISFPLANYVAPLGPSALTAAEVDGHTVTSLALTAADGRYFKTINRGSLIEISAEEYSALTRRIQQPFVHAAVQFSVIAFVLSTAALLETLLIRRRHET